MTKTTDTRQLRMTIDSILSKYEIDNLQLSIDLSTGARMFFEETQSGANAVDVRGRIEKALKTGAQIAARNDAMESRVKKATGLAVNDAWYREGVMQFLLDRETDGQTIESFAQACISNPFSMPKFFKIAEKPALLKSYWGLAFVTQKQTDEERPEYKHFEPEERNVIPNPYKRGVRTR